MHSLSKLLKAALAVSLAVGALYGTRALAGSSTGKPAAPPVAKEAPAPKAPRVIELTVTERGFEPSPIKVKKGEPLKLVVTRKTDQTCATQIVVKDYGIETELPLDKPVEVTFTPTRSGELKYGCAMGMMVHGVLLVE